MFKRIFLFLVVNILTVLTISITLQVFGVRPYLTRYGIDYQALLTFCAIVGFVGAFFSLLTSRIMAKMFMGVHLIDPSQTLSSQERTYYRIVEKLSQKAGLTKTPEIGVYDSPEINAFATGPSKSRALVAVSTGLLNNLDESALEAVLGHEITHITNGDMVTMTLLQGVVNTFVMFFARIAAWFLVQAFSGNRDDRREESIGSSFIYFITVFVLEIFFSLLGAMVVAFFSRWREFRADYGGARLTSKSKMIHALEQLRTHLGVPIDNRHPALSSLKINGKRGGLMSLLASHPDLEVRILALRKENIV